MPGHTTENLLLSREKVGSDLVIAVTQKDVEVHIAVLGMIDHTRLSVQVSGALDYKTFVVGTEMIFVRGRGATITVGQCVIVANDTDRMPLMNGMPFKNMPAIRITNTG